METWLLRVPKVLDEILRHDGLQEHQSLPRCSSCLDASGTYKCIDCTSSILYCTSCAVCRHETLPLHRLEVRARFLKKEKFLIFGLVLERMVLRAYIPQGPGLLLLSQPRTLPLPVTRLENPNHPRD